jgi:hypothetical protein
MATQGTAQVQYNLITTFRLLSNMGVQVQLLVISNNSSLASKHHTIMLGF